MALETTTQRLCDFDHHVISDGVPFITLTGSMQNVESAPGSITKDFCCWAHAIAWAQTQTEFAPPV